MQHKIALLNVETKALYLKEILSPLYIAVINREVKNKAQRRPL